MSTPDEIKRRQDKIANEIEMALVAGLAWDDFNAKKDGRSVGIERKGEKR